MKNLNIKKILIGVLIFLTIYTSYIVIYGLVDNKKKSDVAIILGNKVNEDGSLSARLKARLDKGFELYNNNKVSYIIVSGGLGKEGYYEAEVMKEYLIKTGVSKENIIVDNKGNTTKMTAVNSYEIIKKRNFESIILVSQYFHLLRCELAFEKVGFSGYIGRAGADYFELRDLYSIFRELFAYPKYLIY